jgi:hypothetical protein
MDSRLIDGREIISVLRRPHFTPFRKITGTHFYDTLSQPEGNSAIGRTR